MEPRIGVKNVGRPGLFHFVALRPYCSGMEEAQMHKKCEYQRVGAQCNEVE
jgi:hypothetical protein